MNKKLYELMNWPDIEGVVYSEFDNPKSLLGGHLVKEGFLIQVYRPDAVAIAVTVEGKKTPYMMEKVDEAGFFAVLVPGKKKVDYTLTIESVSGEKKTMVDPYSLPNVTTEATYKAMLAGEEKNLSKILGSHVCEIKGCKGVLFTVWAPAAVNVSVVGDFNKYDGGVNPMERIGNTGVFELFIPGLAAGVEYMYEVKNRSSKAVRKLDPMCRAVSKAPVSASVVVDEIEYEWGDKTFVKNRATKKSSAMAIYEVNLASWAFKSGKKSYATLAEDIAAYVKAQGYTHVALMPVAEYLNDNMFGYSTVAYYAPTSRFGDAKGFKKMVDIFHREKISVILDWNAAYFGTESKGLFDFDGGNAYGYLKPTLEKDASWDVVTFDYSKGAVASFLKSNIVMWLDEFHIDGIRIDGVASMLYLDYGKEPSTWQPNIYGGNENLEAIQFIKDINALVAKRKDGVITIAEESSSWPNVTKANEGDSLGFDYKLNNCWKKDFLEFIGTDPLFRKGEYDKVTYSMLYNYSENFILGLTADTFAKEGEALVDRVYGRDKAGKLAEVRSCLGFMYAHPGAKLVAMGQDVALDSYFKAGKAYWDGYDSSDVKDMEAFVADLNALYTKQNCLYEQDDVSDGFEWLENSNANETVIAFARQNAKGEKLTCVVNFTPVDRAGYRLPVAAPGKYKEIFNSNIKKYGGSDKLSRGFINSDNEDMGDQNYIDIDLPASAFVVFECVPYTDIELEEIAVIKKATAAKRIAEEKAREAERLEKEAAFEAERAVEAEKRAAAAAKAALKAKQEAQKKAEEAIEASKMIDVEMQKKLAELDKKKKK